MFMEILLIHYNYAYFTNKFEQSSNIKTLGSTPVTASNHTIVVSGTYCNTTITHFCEWHAFSAEKYFCASEAGPCRNRTCHKSDPVYGVLKFLT